MSYAWPLESVAPRGALVLILVVLWALRLSVYITWRNWGEGEDYRYREIRRRNEPNFALKSLYLVFGLQAVLAWLVSLRRCSPRNAAPLPLGALDWLGLALAAFGLAVRKRRRLAARAFQGRRRQPRASPRSRALALSRHPNYFGECCVWWGFACFGVAAGGAWSLVSPLLMTYLLLRVSGVTLLEKNIGDRRPGYADYVRRTSAFVRCRRASSP